MGAIDLVVRGAEWSRERKATREESQALGTVLKTVRQVGLRLRLRLRFNGRAWVRVRVEVRARAMVLVKSGVLGAVLKTVLKTVTMTVRRALLTARPRTLMCVGDKEPFLSFFPFLVFFLFFVTASVLSYRPCFALERIGPSRWFSCACASAVVLYSQVLSPKGPADGFKRPPLFASEFFAFSSVYTAVSLACSRVHNRRKRCACLGGLARVVSICLIIVLPFRLPVDRGTAVLLSHSVPRHGARGASGAADDAAQGQAGQGTGPNLGGRRRQPQQACILLYTKYYMLTTLTTKHLNTYYIRYTNHFVVNSK